MLRLIQSVAIVVTMGVAIQTGIAQGDAPARQDKIDSLAKVLEDRSVDRNTWRQRCRQVLLGAVREFEANPPAGPLGAGWLSISAEVGASFPSVMRLKLAEIARAQSSGDFTDKASGADVVAFAKAVNALGDEAHVLALLRPHILSPERLSKLSVSDLTDAVVAVRNSGWRCQHLKLAIAERIKAHTESEKGIRSIPLEAWPIVSGCVGEILDDKQKKRLAEALFEAYWRADMPTRDLSLLHGGAYGLSSLTAVECTVARLSDANVWRNWSLADLSWMANPLLRGPQSAKRLAPVRAAMGKRFTERLAEPQFLGSIDSYNLQRVMRILQSGLTDQQQELWKGAIVRSFAGRQMKASEVSDLAAALRYASPETGIHFVRDWVQSNSQWKDSAFADQVALLGWLRQDAASKGARDAVVDRIQSLAASGRRPFWMDAGGWSRVAACTDTESRRQALGRVLQELYQKADPEAEELTSVAQALKKLTPAQTPRFICAALERGQSWKNATCASTIELVRILDAKDDPAAPAARKILAQAVCDKAKGFSGSVPKSGPNDWSTLLGTLQGDLSDEQKKRIADSLSDVFSRERLAGEELLAVNRLLESLDRETQLAFNRQWVQRVDLRAQSSHDMTQVATLLTWLSKQRNLSPKDLAQNSQMREGLLAKIEVELLSDPSAIKSIPRSAWCRCTSTLPRDDRQRRQRWGQRLLPLLLPGREELPRTDETAMTELVNLHGNVLCRDEVLDLLTAWLGARRSAGSPVSAGDIGNLVQEATRRCELSQDAKAKMARLLQEQYGKTDLAPEDLVAFATAMASLSRQEDALYLSEGLPMWVKWKQGGVETVASLVESIGDEKGDAASAVRKILLGRLEGIVAESGGAGGEQLTQLLAALKRMKPVMSPSQKKTFTELLTKAFSDTELSSRETRVLNEQMRRLDPALQLSCYTKWVTRSKWHQWPATDLHYVVAPVVWIPRRDGELNANQQRLLRTARRTLCDQVEARFFRTEESVRAVPVRAWAEFAKLLQDDEPARRQRWAKRLLPLLTPDQTKLAETDQMTMRQFVGILAHFHAGDKVLQMLTQWLAARRSAGDAVKVNDIAQLVKDLTKWFKLSAPTRRDMAKLLRQHYGQRDLESKELAALSSSMGMLSREETALYLGEGLTTWGKWKSADGEVISALAASIGDLKSPAANGVRQRLAARLEALCADRDGGTDGAALRKLAEGIRRTQFAMSASRKGALARMLADRFSDANLPHRDVRVLHEQLRRLDPGVEVECLSRLIHGARWRGWKVDGLEWLAQSLTWDTRSRGPLSEASKSKLRDARLEFCGEIERRFLVDANSIRSVPGASWQRFIGVLSQDDPSRRRKWSERILNELCGTKEAMASLSEKDITAIVGFCDRLESKEKSKGILTQWLDVRSRQGRPISPRMVSVIAGRLSPDEKDPETLRHLAKAVTHICATDPSAMMQINGRLDRIAEILGEGLTRCEKGVWASGIWLNTWGDRLRARDAMTTLGLSQLADCEREDLRQQKEFPAGPVDIPGPSPALRDGRYARMIAELTIRGESEMMLDPNGIFVGPDPAWRPSLLADLLDGLSLASSSKSGPQAADRPLGYIVQTCRDHEARSLARRALRSSRIRSLSTIAKPESRGPCEAAAFCGAKPPSLLAAAEALLAEPGLKGNMRAQGLMHLVAAEARIDDAVPNPVLARKHLEAAEQSGQVSKSDLGDLRLRLTCHALLGSPAGSREAAVADALADLSALAYVDSATVAALKRVVEKIGPEQPDLVHHLLSRCLLASPDLPSMYAIQRLRTNLFVAQKSTEDAKAGAALEAILALRLPEGPMEAIRRMAFLEGQDADKARSVIGTLAGGERWRRQVPNLFDVPLKKAAAEIAKGQVKLNARGKAWTALVAGQSEPALRAYHTQLASAPTAGRGVADALDDIAVACGIVQNDPACMGEFESWLARGADRQAGLKGPAGLLCQCEEQLPTGSTRQVLEAMSMPRSYRALSTEDRARLARHVVTLQGERAARWVQSAAQQGQDELAAQMVALAVGAPGSAEQACAIGHDVLFRLACLGPDKARAVLEAAAGRCDGVRRAVVLRQTARLRFDRGDHAACVEALKQAEKLAPAAGAEGIQCGFLKAMSLISTKHYDQAIECLQSLQKLASGAPESDARRMFLIGWVYLKLDKPQEARQVLSDAIRRYPDSAFAEKAKAIVSKLG